MLTSTFLALMCLAALHFAFVGGDGACLRTALSAYRGGEASNATSGLGNASAAAVFPLLAEDEILYIRAFPLVDDVAPPLPGTPFSFDYKFARSGAVFMLHDSISAAHSFRRLNLTLPKTCLGPPAFQWSLSFLVGTDTIVLNQLMWGLNLGGYAASEATSEYWSWSDDDARASVGFAEMVYKRVSVLIRCAVVFFLTTTATAVLVRTLIISGIVLMFPYLQCLERLGWNPISIRALAMAYPWVGVPIEILIARRRPISGFVCAHVVHLLVTYIMYEACQYAWSAWLYDKSLPEGLQLWIFGVVLLWEYCSMLYMRASVTIKLLPRVFLIYFTAFHVYLYAVLYSFFYLALFAMAAASLHAMLFFIRRFELKRLDDATLSPHRPRMRYVELPHPEPLYALPPLFSLFHTLNASAALVYDELVPPRPGDAPGGAAAAGEAAEEGGEPGGLAPEQEGAAAAAGGAAAAADGAAAGGGAAVGEVAHLRRGSGGGGLIAAGDRERRERAQPLLASAEADDFV
jgi:hypothetical protein